MFVKKLRQLFGGQPEAAAPVQAGNAAPQAVIIPDNAPDGLVAMPQPLLAYGQGLQALSCAGFAASPKRGQAILRRWPHHENNKEIRLCVNSISRSMGPPIVEVEEVAAGASAPVAAPAPVAPVAAPAPVAAAPAPAAPAAAPAPAPAPAPQAAASGEKVNSPMPGTIVGIKVAQGAAVKKGDVVLILEAMKMENEILSHVDGTIAQIAVAQGASVNSGDLLVVIA